MTSQAWSIAFQIHSWDWRSIKQVCSWYIIICFRYIISQVRLRDQDSRWLHVIARHGNLQMRWTLFNGYLFKFCSVKYQIFHQVFEQTSNIFAPKKTTWKAFQMPPRAIKHQLTYPIELTSGSFLIGRRGILVIRRNCLVVEIRRELSEICYFEAEHRKFYKPNWRFLTSRSSQFLQSIKAIYMVSIACYRNKYQLD